MEYLIILHLAFIFTKSIKIMTVYIRKRQLKENGRYALYLDIYSERKQWQENLKLYLENDKGNSLLKHMNKQTMEIAQKIRVERLHQIQNDTYGFKRTDTSYKSFNDFFLELWKERKRTGVNFDSWDSVYKHLNNFNKTILFTGLNERYLEEFKAFLLGKLKVNSAASYFNIFKHSVHEAFRRRLLRENPASRVKSIREVSTTREHLSKEEIDLLVATECRYPVLKKAFLFSCLTGLRWSDVSKLKWEEIREINGVAHISYTQKKTSNAEVLPISESAVRLMGERKAEDDKVFTGLRYSSYFNTALFTWVADAGIKKHITFHCSRHSNAVMLLNNGVDIYTVSKMLGHKDLKTTSIYAKVVNKTKREAVEKLPVFSI